MILNVKKANSIGWGFIAGNRSGRCFLQGSKLGKMHPFQDLDWKFQALLHALEITMTDGKPKPGSFSGRFGGEERILQLWQIVFGNTATIVPDFQKACPSLFSRLSWISGSGIPRRA